MREYDEYVALEVGGWYYETDLEDLVFIESIDIEEAYVTSYNRYTEKTKEYFRLERGSYYHRDMIRLTTLEGYMIGLTYVSDE